IEVLPGLMPSMIKKIQLTTELPVIAGGLIVRETDMEAAFQAGAVAISTSNTDLWHVKHAYFFVFIELSCYNEAYVNICWSEIWRNRKQLMIRISLFCGFFIEGYVMFSFQIQ